MGVERSTQLASWNVVRSRPPVNFRGSSIETMVPFDLLAFSKAQRARDKLGLMCFFCARVVRRFSTA